MALAPICALVLMPLTLAEPLLLSQIMAEGKGTPEKLFEMMFNSNYNGPTIDAAHARELSRVTIKNITYGHSGYFTVPGCVIVNFARLQTRIFRMFLYVDSVFMG